MRKIASTIGLVFAGFLLVALALNGPSMVKAWKQKRVVDNLFNRYGTALVNKDYQSAYDLAGAEFHHAISSEQFAVAQQQITARLGELKSVKQGHTTVEGGSETFGEPMAWTAQIVGTLLYTKGDMRILYEFHYENGEWRLFGFKEIT